MGIAITAHFRTPSGEHWTLDDPRGTTARVHVRAKANPNPAAENGVDRVEFYIDDGSVTTVSVALPTLCLPNYSLEDSPASGRVGGHAGFWGYELALDLLAETKGQLTITAKVFANNAAELVVPGSVVINNDTDVNKGGSDRRPNKSILHVSRVSGTSGGTGAIGDKVDTLHRALALLDEAGGAEILIYDGFLGTGGAFGASAWFTTAGWPLTVRAAGATKTWEPSVPGAQQPNDYILGATGTHAWLRIVGFEGSGTQQNFYNGGGGVTVSMRLDVIDCSWESEFNDADPAPHVDYFRRSPGNPIAKIEGTGSTFYWGMAIEAFSFGLAGADSAHDIRLTKGLGVYLQPTPTVVPPCYTNITMSGLRYTAGAVRGYVRHTGGTDFTVTKPGGSTMRITLPLAAGVDIAEHAEGIVANTYWGLHVAGTWPAGCAGIHDITAVGYDGSGNPYIDVDNAAGTAGTASSGARIITGELAGQEREYPDAVHTDMLQCWAGPFTGMQLGDIRCFDMERTRGFVGAGQTFTRCSVDFTCDSSPNTGFPDDLENDWQSAVLTDCLFLGNSWRSSANSWNGATISGGAMVDNIFGQATNLVPGTMYVAHNHFVAGSTYGTNTSTGTWFDGNASLTPWSSLPTSGNLNSASGLVDYPVAWRWPGATGDTKGVPRNIGTGDHSITGEAAISPPFTASGEFSVGLTGPGQLIPGFFGQGSLTAILSVTGGMSPAFTGSGVLNIVLKAPGAVSPAFVGTLSFTCALSATGIADDPLPEKRTPINETTPRKPMFTWPIFKRRNKFPFIG